MKAPKVLSAAMLALLCIVPLHASAHTAEEVAQKYRDAGWPESYVQMALNDYAAGGYTQADIDEAYDTVETYDAEKARIFRKIFNMEEPAEEPASADPAADPEAPAEAPEAPAERIPTADFINMTLEEKQAYVASLPADEREAFLASLTPEEQRSIMKQLPVEDKASLVQLYVDTAASMGVDVTVDALTDNDLSLTMRDAEGTIVDRAAVGSVIDDTGISHTRPLLTALLGGLLSAAGFAALYRYIRETQ